MIVRTAESTLVVFRSESFSRAMSSTCFLVTLPTLVRLGSAEPNRNKVGKVTKKQVEDIARLKLPDLNTTNVDSAVRTIMGTARNMGLEVEG